MTNAFPGGIVMWISYLFDKKKRKYRFSLIYKVFNILLGLLCSHRLSFFFDTGAFSTSFPKKIKFRASYPSYLIHNNAFNIWGEDRKKPFYTYTITHFTYCK